MEHRLLDEEARRRARVNPALLLVAPCANRAGAKYPA
jgi:hypothetical protein